MDAKATGISAIAARNFKSFKAIDVKLDPFTILIGPNGAGKSNFIGILRFLRNISQHGLDNAISLEGGVEYLTNAQIGTAEECQVRIRIHPKLALPVRAADLFLDLRSITYELGIRFRGTKGTFSISRDQMTLEGEFSRFPTGRRGGTGGLGPGTIRLTKTAGKLRQEVLEVPEGIAFGKNDIIPAYTRGRRPPKKALLEEEVLLPSYFLRSIIDDFAIFDIDPRLSKRAVPITGIGELEADGSNLPIVLRNVLSNRDSLRKFSNLMNDVLPFISSFRVDKFADKSLMVSVREAYAPRFSLPASLVSDGTINITALILALFFGDKDVVIIEEPERGIHPALLSKITRMLSDASASKQVLVSTHNPEMVSAAPVERLLLITRDEQGFSQVSRPAAQEHVQAFLQSEIGAGDLFVQNLLAP